MISFISQLSTKEPIIKSKFPREYHNNVAIYFANRAACHLQLQNFEDAIKDSTSCVELNDKYTKGYMRRAAAYEQSKKYTSALKGRRHFGDIIIPPKIRKILN